MVRQQALSPLSHLPGPLPVVVYAHVYLWKEPQVEMGDLDLGLGALLWPRSSTKSPIDPRVSSTECRSLYFSPLPLSEFPETQMRLKARKRLLRFRLCKNNRAKEDGKELKEWRYNGRDGSGYHPNGSWRAEGSHDRAAENTRESGSECHVRKNCVSITRSQMAFPLPRWIEGNSRPWETFRLAHLAIGTFFKFFTSVILGRCFAISVLWTDASGQMYLLQGNCNDIAHSL